MSRQTTDNIVATVVDVASIICAYRLGLAQLGIAAGLGYGLFDAWLVVWQRERIAGALRFLTSRVRSYPAFRRRDSLPWVRD